VKKEENVTIRRFLEAGYPCLFGTTFETHRAIDAYLDEITKMNEDELEYPEDQRDKTYEAFRWDLDAGLVDIVNDTVVDFQCTMQRGENQVPIMQDNPLYPIKFLASKEQNVVLFLPNFHVFIGPQGPKILIHAIINEYMRWKDTGKCVVILAPEYSSSTELDRLFQLVDFPLPDEDHIKTIMAGVLPDTYVNPKHDPSDEDSEEFLVEFTDDAIRAAKGMTSTEIENALSLSIIEKDQFDPIVISRIKQQQIKKSATLEISTAKHKFEDIIGLEYIKPYLTKVAMHPLAQGSLFVGVQGCSKTYTAEALANEFGIPAVVVDFSKMMAAGGGIVGQAQAQAINTFKTLDAMSPCIAIFDELEKGLSGIQSSGYSDAGTKAGVGSVFLKWIEKKTPGIYPIATCNNIDMLPPEYKRAGRWDTIIGFDLPIKQDIYNTLLYYGEKWLNEEEAEQLEEDLDEAGSEILDDKDDGDTLYGYSHAELMTIVKQMAMINCSVREAMGIVKKIKNVDFDAVSNIRKWISNNAMMAGESYYGMAKLFVPKGKDIVKRQVKKKKKKKVSLVE
jgi:hypothetical protein